MKPTKLLQSFLLAAGSSLLAISSSSAADLFWDANGGTSGTGGSGVWNAANTWRSGSTSGSLGNWSNSNNAVFGGTAGTVTLSSSVIVSQMQFDTVSYNIGATTDTTNTISFNGGTYSSSNPTIKGTSNNITMLAKLTGTVTGGFFLNAGAVTGTGTSRFALRNTSNDFTGDIHVISGNLAIESDNAVYGNAANKVILNAGDNGGLSISAGSSIDRTFSRAIEIGASNAKLTTLANADTVSDTSSVVVNFTGAITGSGTWNRVGSLTGSGTKTSTMHLAGDMSGFTGTYVNASGGDTVVRTTAGSGGHWRVDTGTLSFGTGTFATTNNLTVNTGGIFSMGSNSLSFGNLTGTGGTINGTSGDRTLTIGAGDANGGNFQGVIANGTGGTVALNKTGAGTQTLSGSNTFTGGTRIDNGTLTLGHATDTLATGGAINVNGGTLALGANSDTVGAVTLTSGSITSSTGVLNGASYAVQSGNVSAILGGSGVALTKSTSGTVTLSGVNTYTGATSVNSGTLFVNGSLAAGSAVSVGASGALGGTGTINGAATILGAHTPGNSPGIQTFGSNLTYSGGSSTVEWELVENTTTNPANPNAVYDQILVNGSLDFAGATSLSLLFNGPGSSVLWTNPFWDTDRQWMLYDVAVSTTNFGNLSLAAGSYLDSGSNPLASARPNASFNVMESGSDVVISYVAVPEPTSIGILGTGVALLGLRIARRRKA